LTWLGVRERQIEALNVMGRGATTGDFARQGVTDFLNSYADDVKNLRTDIRGALPVSEKFQKSLAGGIVAGFGQLPASLAAYSIPGLGPLTSVGGLYDEAYQDALAHGADAAKAHEAGLYSIPAGALDFAMDKVVLGKILKPLKGKLTVGELVKTFGVTAAAGGTTEGLQQGWLNFSAKYLAGYDPERKLDDDVINSVLIGAVVDSTVSTAGQALVAERKSEVGSGKPEVGSAGSGPDGLAGVRVDAPGLTPEEEAMFAQGDAPGLNPDARFAPRDEEGASTFAEPAAGEPVADGEESAGSVSGEQLPVSVQPAADSQEQNNVVVLSGKEFGDGLDISTLRKKAADHMDDLRGTVVDRADGGAILIDRTGAKETVSGKRRAEELQALAGITDLIAGADYVGQEPDRKGRADVVAWHEYRAPVQIAGKDYRATIKVRELRNGLRFYDSYILNESEPATKSGTADRRSEELGSPNSEVTSSTETIGPEGGAVKVKQSPKLANGQGGFINTEILGEVADYGRAIYRQGMGFVEWAGQMVQRFGDGVRAVLRNIFESINGGGWNENISGSVLAGDGENYSIRKKKSDDFVERALTEPSFNGSIVLRKVSKKEAAQVVKQGGPDISGFEHILDAAHLRHALNQHSDPAKEAAYAVPQRPLTLADLKRIPDVIDSPDTFKVEVRGKNRTSLVYSRAFDAGRVVYVEKVLETSTRKKPRLVTKTAWVVAEAGVKSSPTQVYTPDRIGNLGPDEGEVNYPISKANDIRGTLRAKLKNSEGGFINAEILAEVVDYGRTIVRAGMDFVQWAGRMVRDLGDGVRAVLRKVWDAINGGQLLPHARETGAARVPERNRGFVESARDSDAVKFAKAKPGMKLAEVRGDFPVDDVVPVLLAEAGSMPENMRAVAEVFQGFPKSVTAADGSVVRLKSKERGSMAARVRHLIFDHDASKVNGEKLAWLPNVTATVENAAVRLVDGESGNRIYVRAYQDGTKHMVVVRPDGVVDAQGPFTGSLITQFPKGGVKQQGMTIDWVRPESGQLPPAPVSPPAGTGAAPESSGRTDTSKQSRTAGVVNPANAQQVRGWVAEVLRTWRTELRVVVHDSAVGIADAGLRQSVMNEGGAVEVATGFAGHSETQAKNS